MWTLLLGALVFVQTLSFEEALERAPETPAVAGARSAQEHRKKEASGMRRLTDNPVVQVQPGYRDMHNGGSGPEVYLGITQRVRLTQYGPKRQAAVEREIAHDRARWAAALREARREIARAWLARWAAQEAALTAQVEITLARELLHNVQTAFKAGEATRVDVAQIETWLAEASLLALQTEGVAFDSGVELARAIGQASRQPFGAAERLPEIDLPSDDALDAALIEPQSTPAVARAQAARAADAARLVEARATRGTELNVGALGWREGGGDLAAVATLEVTLPVAEHGKRESASFAAALAEAEQGERAALLDAHSERMRILHEVVHTEEVLAATEGALVPAAESLADAQRRRLEAREGTSQDWVLARRAVLRAHLDATNARAARTLARFRAHEALSQASAKAP